MSQPLIPSAESRAPEREPLLADDLFPMLITGATGVVGYSAIPYFQHRYPGRVMAVASEGSKLAGPGIVSFHLEDHERLARLFREHRFRSVLHTCGNCALKACELDPVMARRVNVEVTANLLRQLRENSGDPVRLIHLSSDLVYGGDRPVADQPGYLETHPTDPVTVYGKTMAEAEAMVLVEKPDALVLRISLPMGPSFNGHAGAIDWISSRFKKDRPATLYYDEVRTPTFVGDMNRAFERLFAMPTAKAHGIYHFGSPRPITLFQIAQVINRIGDFRPELLHGCPRRDAGPMPPRAGNVTMDSRRIEELLGERLLRPWPMLPEGEPSGPDWHWERPATEKRGWSEVRRLLYGHEPESDRRGEIPARATG